MTSMVTPMSSKEISLRGPSIVASGISRWKRQASKTKRLWNYVQVDWHSYYTLDKQLALYEHPQRTIARCILTLLLTPIPVLLIALLLEAIPLADPSLGWRRNGAFFLRTTLQRLFMGVATELQLRAFHPELSFPPCQHLLSICFQTSVTVGCHMAVSEFTGVFPLPFGTFCIMPISMLGAWIPRKLSMRHKRQGTTNQIEWQTLEHKQRATNSLATFLSQLAIVYSIFASVLSRIQARYQVLLIVILYVLRLVFKHIEWTRMHHLVGRSHSNDLAVMAMTTNSHFFGALFTATCFQTTKSVSTLALILLFGVYQDFLSIRAIDKRFIHLTSIQPPPERWTTLTPPKASPVICFQELVAVWRANIPLSVAHHDSTYPPFRHLPVPVAIGDETQPSTITSSTIEWVETLLHFSHCRELVLVRAYMDLVIPCLYLIVVSAIHTLPNAKYLSYLGHSDVRTLTLRLGSQILVRGIIFVWFLRRLPRVDHVTGLHQLEFVLSRQLGCFYGSTIFVALGIFGFAVAHNGNDTTFRFEWLHH